MGHRLEVYLSPEHAEEVIAISKSFNIDAQIVGRVEESDKKELIIKSEFGEFIYEMCIRDRYDSGGRQWHRCSRRTGYPRVR